MTLNALIEKNPGIQVTKLEIPECDYCGKPKKLVAAGINSFVFYCENKACVNWHYPTEVEYDAVS